MSRMTSIPFGPILQFISLFAKNLISSNSFLREARRCLLNCPKRVRGAAPGEYVHGKECFSPSSIFQDPSGPKAEPVENSTGGCLGESGRLRPEPPIPRKEKADKVPGNTAGRKEESRAVDFADTEEPETLSQSNGRVQQSSHSVVPLWVNEVRNCFWLSDFEVGLREFCIY